MIYLPWFLGCWDNKYYCLVKVHIHTQCGFGNIAERCNFKIDYPISNVISSGSDRYLLVSTFL